jgi:7,8-dihydropterin-6-yl-methyl-4-(beta-D-ribofuranosyl)aminobenzene 5'-phosphate synthase
MKIQILFERESLNPKFSCGWGLSFLVSGEILFDCGEDYAYLEQNSNLMGVDIKKVKKVVISHDHWDHTGGLRGLKEKDLEVYICKDSGSDFKLELEKQNRRIRQVLEPELIQSGVYSSGQFITSYKDKRLAEQSLVIKTERGISILCGCSHPNILNIVNKVKEHWQVKKIHAVIGGFHLINQEERIVNFLGEELKRLAVENIAPSHCTGPEAEHIIKKIYKDNFIKVKTGKTIEV